MDHEKFFKAAARMQMVLWVLVDPGCEPPALVALTALVERGQGNVAPDELRAAVCDVYEELREALEALDPADGLGVTISDMCAVFPDIGKPLTMMMGGALKDTVPEGTQIFWNTMGGPVPVDLGAAVEGGANDAE